MEGIAWWDWLGIGLGVVGVVAFIMAVQPFTQAIFGRPKILVRFNTKDDIPRHIALQCGVVNVPVIKGILNVLQVDRQTAEELWAPFDIIESHQGTKVFGAV